MAAITRWSTGSAVCSAVLRSPPLPSEPLLALRSANQLQIGFRHTGQYLFVPLRSRDIPSTRSMAYVKDLRPRGSSTPAEVAHRVIGGAHDTVIATVRVGSAHSNTTPPPIGVWVSNARDDTVSVVLWSGGGTRSARCRSTTSPVLSGRARIVRVG